MKVILLANWHAAPGYKKGDVVDLALERVSYGLKAGLCALLPKKKNHHSKNGVKVSSGPRKRWFIKS